MQTQTRTNIVIDDRLMNEAMRLSGLATKKAVIEAALKLMIQISQQSEIRKLRGKVRWEGNLDESRRGRVGAGAVRL